MKWWHEIVEKCCLFTSTLTFPLPYVPYWRKIPPERYADLDFQMWFWTLLLKTSTAVERIWWIYIPSIDDEFVLKPDWCVFPLNYLTQTDLLKKSDLKITNESWQVFVSMLFYIIDIWQRRLFRMFIISFRTKLQEKTQSRSVHQDRVVCRSIPCLFLQFWSNIFMSSTCFSF